MRNNLITLFAFCAVVGFAQAKQPASPSGSPAPASAATSAEREESQQMSPRERQYRSLMKSISWTKEGSAAIGGMAQIKVPEGYGVTGQSGTIQLLKFYGNLTGNRELALMTPTDGKSRWFIVFEFDDVGYVKEDEKDKLDADKILDQMRKGQEMANEELLKQGQSTLQVMGWKKPPFYNPETHNLEWAIRLQDSEGGENVNYKTKILGRRGVMEALLVCGEEELDRVLPEYQHLLAGFEYKQEHSYAAFTKGDKVAKYGLTGLIVGGGLLLAAKSGLLAKFMKPIIVGIVAIGAFFKRLIFGRKNTTKDDI